jgi:hypothetical protein
VSETLDILVQIGVLLGKLFVSLAGLVAGWPLLVVLWIAWCLWAVNWKKIWPVLAEGAWVPVLLLTIGGALAWSQLAPSKCDCLRFVTVPNFWWQLGEICLFGAVTLFCGWVQGLLGWQPAEIELEPPVAAAHGNGHGHH